MKTASTPDLPFAARTTLRVLQHIEHGQLVVDLPNGSQQQFGDGTARAVITFHDWAAFRRILRDGDIGFAEGYLDGLWETPDLAQLLTLLASNREPLDRPLYGSWFGRLLHRGLHLLRANTRRGSQRNIAAHYDLGNDFYAQWLDPSMTYSSALFDAQPSRTLEAAQHAKYQRILETLSLAPDARILEIGCGWGGFAEAAARRGYQVHGITLSREQLRYAQQRLLHAGLAQRAQFEFRDYRDLQGKYDAVVSIEMVEAVGERWWPTYVERIAAALSSGGRAIVQAITIDEALFDRYRRGSDFIQQYIFPGGMLFTPSHFTDLAARAKLNMQSIHRFGKDYARTLTEWDRRFVSAAPAIQAQGFDDRFMRMWRFYLAYCQAGFLSGSTDVAQFSFVRA